MADIDKQEKEVSEIEKSFKKFREDNEILEELFGAAYFEAIPILIEELFSIPFKDWSLEALSDHLLADKNEVYAKYSLPNPRLPYSEYLEELYEIASVNKVYIGHKFEREGFFKERMAAGVNMRNDGVYLDKPQLPSADLEKDKPKLNTLQHELIHAIQNLRFPGMPLIRKEYEAYLVEFGPKTIREKPFMIFLRLLQSLEKAEIESMAARAKKI